jgi:hypothetical protein
MIDRVLWRSILSCNRFIGLYADSRDVLLLAQDLKNFGRKAGNVCSLTLTAMFPVKGTLHSFRATFRANTTA